MFCSKCGAQNADGTQFCASCGAPLNANTTAPYQQPVVVNVVNNNENNNVNSINVGGFPRKSKWTAFFLCLFLGIFGAHRFYAGKTGSAILYLFTVGLFGFGVLIDLVLILIGSFRDKYGYPLV